MEMPDREGWLTAASDAGRVVLACVHPASGDVGFWSSFATTSKAERLHARIVQQNTGTQLLFKILQE